MKINNTNDLQDAISSLNNNGAGLITLTLSGRERFSHYLPNVLSDWINSRNGWGDVEASEFENDIHETAIISRKANIGNNVKIGAYSMIHEGVTIDDNTEIGEHCVIGSKSGSPLFIGKKSIIRSHNIIYGGSSFKESLETGHHVVIREGTIAGVNLRVGSFGDIEGDCTIGDYNRFHSYVHVGKGSKIGNFIWLYSLVTLTNDPLPPSNIHDPVEIQDGCVVCVGSTILPGTILKQGVFVCAGSQISGVIQKGQVVKGENNNIGHVAKLINLDHGIHHPWMHHFDKGYPEQCKNRLMRLYEQITNS